MPGLRVKPYVSGRDRRRQLVPHLALRIRIALKNHNVSIFLIKSPGCAVIAEAQLIRTDPLKIIDPSAFGADGLYFPNLPQIHLKPLVNIVYPSRPVGKALAVVLGIGRAMAVQVVGPARRGGKRFGRKACRQGSSQRLVFLLLRQ